MYIDPNLARWVSASISDLLRPVIEDDLNLVFWTEGVDFEEQNLFQKDNAVLRVTGPLFFPGSNQDKYVFEVFVLLTDLFGTTTDAYNLMRQTGTVANTLSRPIPVYRYGGGPDDDESLVGCLDIDGNSREFVRQLNYGVIDKDTRVKQMAVIARYELLI